MMPRKIESHLERKLTPEHTIPVRGFKRPESKAEIHLPAERTQMY